MSPIRQLARTIYDELRAQGVLPSNAEVSTAFTIARRYNLTRAEAKTHVDAIVKGRPDPRVPSYIA